MGVVQSSSRGIVAAPTPLGPGGPQLVVAWNRTHLDALLADVGMAPSKPPEPPPHVALNVKLSLVAPEIV